MKLETSPNRVHPSPRRRYSVIHAHVKSRALSDPSLVVRPATLTCTMDHETDPSSEKPIIGSRRSLYSEKVVLSRYLVNVVLISSAVGWLISPFETTYAATRLALSGLLEEYPDIVFVLSHLGGTLPYLVGRIDDGNRIYKEHQSKIREPPSEYLRKMYLDTASFYEPALNCAHDFWGAGMMLLGSDYPYGWVGDLRRCSENIERLEIGEEGKKKILHLNAEKILKLHLSGE